MRTITKIFLFFLATLSLLGGIYAIAAWQSPTAGPPANNTDAPLNIGSDFQEKTGGLKLLYLILKPGEKPADTEGAMFYDTANKIFQCFQNDKWYNCLGYILPKIKADNSGFETDILQIINPLRTDKMARLANILGPVENNDAANKEFVVNYVDDKVGSSGSGSLSDIKQSWQIYNIYITPDTHDGNFGGLFGPDQFCQNKFGKQCLGFSSEMISASYVGGNPLNFSTWDTSFATSAVYSRRHIVNDYDGSHIYYRGMPKNSASNSCKGYTSNSPLDYHSFFLYTYEQQSKNNSCNKQQYSLCACPGLTLKRWKIIPTSKAYDGNLGGYPGADKICSQELGQGCVMFTTDIIHSSYYDGPKLNFAQWNNIETTDGWFGIRYIAEDYGYFKGAVNIITDISCKGWTTNSGFTGYVFFINGINSDPLPSVSCKEKKPVICACPEN